MVTEEASAAQCLRCFPNKSRPARYLRGPVPITTRSPSGSRRHRTINKSRQITYDRLEVEQFHQAEVTFGKGKERRS